MSFSETYAQNVVGYMRQMRVERTNHWALYYPHPRDGREIEIGDVGLIYAGSFRLLFNAAVERTHELNFRGSPEGHKPLPYNMSTDVTIYDESRVLMPNTPCCSDRIKWESITTDSEKYVVVVPILSL